MKIRLKDFPQLRLIAWQMGPDETVDGTDALALYERNWRFVDQAGLDDKEKALIADLVRQYGCGVMLV